MTSGGIVTLANFQDKDLTFQQLTPYLIRDATVSRSLSNNTDYRPAMKRVLLDGPVSRDDKDRSLFVEPSRRGLLELMDNLFYDFPSPLHRQIWSWILKPSNGYNYTGNMFSLIKATIAGFRPNQLSRRDRRAETDERNPPEAQYSHEWYRSLHEVMDGNVVVSPEYATAPGKRLGRVDFYIPSMKWGLEIIRDGSKLREHSDRFITGAYSTLMRSGDIVDYALLDFRHDISNEPTPG
jgi:hypothetical protein